MKRRQKQKRPPSQSRLSVCMKWGLSRRNTNAYFEPFGLELVGHRLSARSCFWFPLVSLSIRKGRSRSLHGLYEWSAQRALVSVYLGSTIVGRFGISHTSNQGSKKTLSRSLPPENTLAENCVGNVNREHANHGDRATSDQTFTCPPFGHVDR